MGHRAVHYTMCDSCNISPVYGVLMQRTLGGDVTSFCSDCYCVLSDNMDEKGGDALLEQRRAEISANVAALALHNAKTVAAEALWRQMQAHARQMEAALSELENSTRELSLQQDSIRKHNRMYAARQTGVFKSVHRPVPTDEAQPLSGMCSELETIRTLTQNFIDTLDKNYNENSFLYYKDDTLDAFPDPAMRRVYTMIRNIKIFNEVSANHGDGIWSGFSGTRSMEREKSNILFCWRSAARCLLNGTFVLRDANHGEHIVNVAVMSCPDWEEWDKYIDELRPEPVYAHNGEHIVNYKNGTEDDVLAFYMQTLESSSDAPLQLHAQGSTEEIWTAPAKHTGFKQIAPLTDEDCRDCVLQTINSPATVVLRLHVENRPHPGS